MAKEMKEVEGYPKLGLSPKLTAETVSGRKQTSAEPVTLSHKPRKVNVCGQRGQQQNHLGVVSASDSQTL